MQKKLAVGVLALVSAAFFAVGFAACDVGNQEVGKDTNLSEVKSETVTEAQWKEVFKAENFNNFKSISKMNFTGEESGSRTQELAVDGNKCYGNDVRGTETYEYYYATENGKNYAYEKEGLVWTRLESSFSMVSEMKEMFTEYGEYYSAFTYSEADKGYKMTETDEGESNSIIIKISNGKLCGIITAYSYTYEEQTLSRNSEVIVYGYGEASVILPAEFIDGDDGDDDDEDGDYDDDNGDDNQGGEQGGETSPSETFSIEGKSYAIANIVACDEGDLAAVEAADWTISELGVGVISLRFSADGVMCVVENDIEDEALDLLAEEGEETEEPDPFKGSYLQNGLTVTVSCEILGEIGFASEGLEFTLSADGRTLTCFATVQVPSDYACEHAVPNVDYAVYYVFELEELAA